MKLHLAYRYLVTKIFWLKRFKNIGVKSFIFRPFLISNPQFISVGDRCIIRDGARLEVIHNSSSQRVPALNIGNNVNIEQGVHIVCQSNIEIEDYVSITPYCVIVDTEHPFNDPDKLPKIGDRINFDETKKVRIGRGTFVGAHSIILPGVNIGRGCVIGAGSVVTKNIPDYSLASGNPARVIKRFDPIDRMWKIVDKYELKNI